jgi:hypothetical protein
VHGGVSAPLRIDIRAVALPRRAHPQDPCGMRQSRQQALG